MILWTSLFFCILFILVSHLYGDEVSRKKLSRSYTIIYRVVYKIRIKNGVQFLRHVHQLSLPALSGSTQKHIFVYLCKCVFGFAPIAYTQIVHFLLNLCTKYTNLFY